MTDTLHATPLPPMSLEPAVTRYTVRAEYFEGQINPKTFRAAYPHYAVLASDPLVIEPERGSMVALTKFGAVVFWNCSPATQAAILRELKELPGVSEQNLEVSDSLEVHVGKTEDKVTFDEVWLQELTLAKVKVISLALGQSVALDRFERELSNAMQRTEPVAQALAERGALILSPRRVLRSVGFAMGVRSAVLANLTLFDSPPEAWESEGIAHLDTELYDHFDLAERLSAVNQKVAFLADINTTLIEVLSHRKSHRLEWMIILLILFEIVYSLVKEFTG